MFSAHVIEETTADPNLSSRQKEPLWSVQKDGVEVFKIRADFGYVNKLIRLIRRESRQKATPPTRKIEDVLQAITDRVRASDMAARPADAKR